MNEDSISSFPPPPSYFKNFSDESSIESIPPPKPILGSYTTLGRFFTTEKIQPSLKEENLKELFRSKNEKYLMISNQKKILELKKMMDSLALNFTELLKILVENPVCEIEETEEISIFEKKLKNDVKVEKPAYMIKIEHIQLLLINMSFLLNSFRKYQAKHNLIQLIQKQIERRIETKKNLEDTIEKCKNLLSFQYDEISKWVNEKKVGGKKRKFKDISKNEIKEEDKMEIDKEFSIDLEKKQKTKNDENFIVVNPNIQKIFDQYEMEKK